MRDYAAAWEDRLHRAPDHQHAAALVQLVTLSDDEALMAWARSATSGTRATVPTT